MGIGTRERATRAVVDLEISHSLSVIVVRYRHPEPLFGANVNVLQEFWCVCPGN